MRAGCRCNTYIRGAALLPAQHIMAVFAAVCVVALLATGSYSRTLTEDGDHGDHRHHADSHHADHTGHTADHHADQVTHHGDHSEHVDHKSPLSVLSNVSPNIAKLLLPLLKDSDKESLEIVPKKRTKQVIQVLPFRRSTSKVPKKHVVEITPVHSNPTGGKPLAYILSAADAAQIMNSHEAESQEDLLEPILLQENTASVETDTRVFSAEEPIPITVSASTESEIIGTNSQELSVPSIEPVEKAPIVYITADGADTEARITDPIDLDTVADTDLDILDKHILKESLEIPSILEPETFSSASEEEEIIKTSTEKSLEATDKTLFTKVKDSSSFESGVTVNISPSITDAKNTDNDSIVDNNLEVEINDLALQAARRASDYTSEVSQATTSTDLSKILSSLPLTAGAPTSPCYRGDSSDARERKSYILSFLFNK